MVRCGKHVGLRVQCGECGELPPKQRLNEDFKWYGYRRWRWLAVHQASHSHEKIVAHRRIVARERFIQEKKEKAASAAA